MKTPAILLLLAVLFVPHLQSAEKPDRVWTTREGIVTKGTYLRCDGLTVWIRKPLEPAAFPVPLANLSPSDQAVVKEFQSDFSWKLPLVRWPGVVPAPATRSAMERGTPSKGLHTFQTKSFEFQADTPLKPAVVTGFGQTFEATCDLFAKFPWDIRPAPPDGTHYKVRLYSDRSDFMKATGVEDQGSAKILGLYLRNDRLIHVPLESLLSGKHADNSTLRHELTHQMMHDLLPLMPWWVSEGTAEYVRSIPWDGRGAFNCAGILTPVAMKKLAAEGEMNERAFNEMLTDTIAPPREAQEGDQLASAHGREKQELLRIRQDRAGQLAGRAAEDARRKQIAGEFTAGVQYGTATAVRSPLADEGQATVLKYHAAKLLVYYLQHLEGDGKGAKMLQLMWHLRQWSDEFQVHRTRFAKEGTEFRTKFEQYRARAKDFDKMETAYHAKFLNWQRTNTGKPTDPPKPVAPEEELLTLLPAVPDYAVFNPLRLQARWSEIKKKTIGENPDRFYRGILDAFAAKKIKLPVLEGDPRTMNLKPFKVQIK